MAVRASLGPRGQDCGLVTTVLGQRLWPRLGWCGAVSCVVSGSSWLFNKQRKRKLGSFTPGAWGQHWPSLALGPMSLVALE